MMERWIIRALLERLQFVMSETECSFGAPGLLVTLVKSLLLAELETI